MVISSQVRTVPLLVESESGHEDGTFRRYELIGRRQDLNSRTRRRMMLAQSLASYCVQRE